MGHKLDKELTEKHNLKPCSMGRCCNAQVVDELSGNSGELEAENKSLKIALCQMRAEIEHLERSRKKSECLRKSCECGEFDVQFDRPCIQCALDKQKAKIKKYALEHWVNPTMWEWMEDELEK